MGIFCGASTYAVGKIFVRHFESGGTFLNFNPEQVKEAFQKEFDDGSKLAANCQKEQPVQAAA
jgi:hypothetical protein